MLKRRTTINYDERIAELEKQIESLQALLDKEVARSAEERKLGIDTRIEHLKIIKSVNDRLSEHIERAQRWEEKHRDDGIEVLQLIVRHSDSLCEKAETIKLIGKEQLLMRREFMRLDEVYYHVFPERLSQDIKFLDQLAALGPTPAPDVDPKKG